MIISVKPVVLTEMIGSFMVMLFAFFCIYQISIIKKRDNHIIWNYLNRLCLAVAFLGIASAGSYLLEQGLLFANYPWVWEFVFPFSKAINTLLIVAAGFFVFNFNRNWKIHEQVLSDKKAIELAHDELMFLNQNIEKLVAERTEALASSVYKYHRIFEVATDMIVVTDNDGTIMDINPGGLKILGYDNSETIPVGVKFQSFFENPEEWQYLKKKIDQQGFITSEAFTLKCIDGLSKRALISSGVHKGANLPTNTRHFFVKDIEQHKMMEQHLAQADKLASIGQLSSGIAHEINNPLGIILGYTQLLLRSENPESEKYKDLKTIEKHVRTCKGIVEDLLNFAQSSKPVRNVVVLNDLIEDMVLFVQQHAKLGKVQITRKYDKSIPPMPLEEKKMGQAIMNLIMNAGHAVGKKGNIGISTRYSSGEKQVLIEITDTGCGIEPKYLPRIFDPFFTTKPTGEGTGLGLSVSYGIIKNHGGDIFVKSEPDGGSTFTVVLPLNTSSL